MTKSLRRNGAWMLGNALYLALLICGTGPARATGYYGPDEYLSRWKSLDETPEFYWQLELKRLASAYHPKEKLNRTWPQQISNEDDTGVWDRPRASIDDADKADFQAALKDGEIKATDPQQALDAHMKVRTQLDNDFKEAIPGASPSESGSAPSSAIPSQSGSASINETLDSEFGDYNRGAVAYSNKDWESARKAWWELLDRPAAERKYRTVWAAFMLGKLALKTGGPDAVSWFEKTRQFAAQGFGDSLGLAADSYGWEGRAFLKLDHPEKAAPMYLNQLALGDVSAVVSLKALIPDRVAVDGLLNYGADAPAPPSDSDKPAPPDPLLLKRLQTMAADPLLRRLETAHILATESSTYEGAEIKPERSERWLKVLQEAKLAKVEDAGYLGWVAYNTGQYAEAQHWLAMSDGESPAAAWLRARLQLRAGKPADAATSMANAWAGLTSDLAYTSWNHQTDDNDAFVFLTPAEDEGMGMTEWAGGDMASLHLMRGDFLQALDVFLKGGLWEDAAYVAERVLTTDELKSYVDKMPPAATGTDGDTRDNTASMRYLLGRRLVREDHYPEAGQYLPVAYAKLLGKYAEALKNGANASASKSDRAAGWSTAAWIARHDGLELMGTEVAPDGFDSSGAFQNADIANARLTGTAPALTEDGSNTIAKLPFPAVKAEAERIRKDPVHPDVRYHYRVIAAALVLRAAELLPDNSEELADALNCAGNWVKDRDEKLGDQYYGMIERRCPKTKIGKAVLAKHWFVDDTGPWSAALTSAEDARHKELGIQGQQ